MTRPVCIVMATYNGALFIREQIKSIQMQSSDDWRLLVRDDGSTDGTIDILSQAAASDPRITILDSSCNRRLGPSLNFSTALEAALKTKSDIFFIADQDDVWESDKLLLQSNQFPLKGAEELPLLVHSDLAVVNQELDPVHLSLIAYMKLTPRAAKPLESLLTRNFVTGCASACNRQLLKASLPIPPDAMMHDWWLALVAAALGEIRYVDQPLARYRQHLENSIGARGIWKTISPIRNWISEWRASNIEYRSAIRQVVALSRHEQKLGNWPENTRETLQDYLELGGLSMSQKLVRARKMGLRQGTGLLQLIFYIRLLTVDHRRQVDA